MTGALRLTLLGLSTLCTVSLVECITWDCKGAVVGANASKKDRSWDATFPTFGVGAAVPAPWNAGADLLSYK